MMKRHFSSLAFLALVCSGLALGQEEVPVIPAEVSATTPVPFPELKHYSPLWEKSLFTTKDLPSPDAPSGPSFTESLALSGIYEVDGQVVAVLVDRTTSQISEARMEQDNEAGIKIRKVSPGASMDKTRVQLQKGDQVGWVAFADAPPPPAAPPAQSLQTRQPAAAGGPSSPLLPPPQVPAVPAAPAPPARVPGDVPLPP